MKRTISAWTVTPTTLIWVIGLLAMTEALLEAGAAALEGDEPRAVLWVAGAIVIFALAVLVERVKAESEP